MITIFHLPELGLIKVSGADASKLLQGQLTCNIEKIPNDKSLLGAHCNPQGRVISLFRIFQLQDAYYLLLPRSMVSIAINALKKYAVFYKTELTDASHDFMWLGLKGDVDELAIFNPLTFIKIVPGYHIMLGDFELIKNCLKQYQHLPLSAQDWKRLEIQHGIPTIYPETTEKFLPHEINLPNLAAIDFNKGCYTGQEIIARMHYRGKLKKQMVRAKLTSDFSASPGIEIYSQYQHEKSVCGSIVDICREEYNNYISLIVTEESKINSHALFLETDYQAFFTILYRFPL